MPKFINSFDECLGKTVKSVGYVDKDKARKELYRQLAVADENGLGCRDISKVIDDLDADLTFNKAIIMEFTDGTLLALQVRHRYLPVDGYSQDVQEDAVVKLIGSPDLYDEFSAFHRVAIQMGLVSQADLAAYKENERLKKEMYLSGRVVQHDDSLEEEAFSV